MLSLQGVRKCWHSRTVCAFVSRRSCVDVRMHTCGCLCVVRHPSMITRCGHHTGTPLVFRWCGPPGIVCVSSGGDWTHLSSLLYVCVCVCVCVCARIVAVMNFVIHSWQGESYSTWVIGVSLITNQLFQP